MAKKKKEYKPLSYVKAKEPSQVNISKPGKYNSALHDKISKARKQVMNFKYDPLQDANYQALAQIYAARGNLAAQDTLGDAASLNGGFGTSYAVSAAQQARNQYNQELASLVPELEQNAYQKAMNNYSMLVERDNDLYGRWRDKMSDYQWGKDYNANMYQWGKDYDTGVYQYKQEQKKNSSGGGGGGGRRGRRSYGGGGGYYGGGDSGGLDIDSIWAKAQDDLSKKKKKKATGKITSPNTVSYGQSKAGGRIVK